MGGVCHPLLYCTSAYDYTLPEVVLIVEGQLIQPLVRIYSISRDFNHQIKNKPTKPKT